MKEGQKMMLMQAEHLTVKFFHSYRTGMINEYFGWILADIAVLLGIEVILALVCFRWPRSWVIRIACVIAAVVCTWSIINAGWVIRSGMQIMPTVFVSIFLDPVTSLVTIITNIIHMKVAAVILLVPTAVAIVFFCRAKPSPTTPARLCSSQPYTNSPKIRRISRSSSAAIRKALSSSSAVAEICTVITP